MSRVHALALLLLLISIPSSAAQASASATQRHVYITAEEYVVEGFELHEDEILHVAGTVMIAPGAELVLRHTEMRFEGNKTHALGVRPAQNGTPAGTLRLESTEAGPTWVRTTGPEVTYFMSSYGTVETRGRPGAPVLIENVTGLAARPIPSVTNGGVFFNGLQLIGPRNLIENTVFRLSGAGIGIAGGGDTRILNSSIHFVNTGIYLQHAKNILIENTTIFGSEAGIFSHTATNVTIRDSIISGGEYGLIARSSDLQVHNTRLNGTKQAMHVYQGGTYHIENNTFEGYTFSGLASHQEEINDDPTSLVIKATNNSFDGRGQADAGIVIENAQVVLISDNDIASHLMDGVFVMRAGAVTLRDNRLVDNGRYGVEIAEARFREETNAFEEPSDGVAHFLGFAPVSFTVRDSAGEPVANATIQVFRDSQLYANTTVDATGTHTTPLETLFIANDRARLPRMYEVSVSSPGYAPFQRTFTPYDENDLMEIQLVASDSSMHEATSASGPDTLQPTWVVTGLITAALVLLLATRLKARTRRKKEP